MSPCSVIDSRSAVGCLLLGLLKVSCGGLSACSVIESLSAWVVCFGSD